MASPHQVPGRAEADKSGQGLDEGGSHGLAVAHGLMIGVVGDVSV
jgi:hypothetical protein